MKGECQLFQCNRQGLPIRFPPMADLRRDIRKVCFVQPTSERATIHGAIGSSGFGELRMLAVAFAARRVKYHSAPAET